ncbi:copper resistance D family protein [Jannaschia sp. W003]|uniref:copper resistance D family protein n=1 Tax=Jannaschia sp. W003 TaxID=2867012 RepID=UPI0021A88CE7|nr:CopD family protein [Jannaschia sp. W003]UWQ22088.1 CopD family protein [Jannaschia sp. W003]
MEGLAPLDALTVLAVAAKAAGYAAALLAAGGAIFLALFREADALVLRLARRVAVAAALAGLAVLALRFGIRAARISGLGLDGATDPVMLGFVWQSPLGAAAVWRASGEIAILAVLLPGLVGRIVPLLGALAVAVSYAQVGHTLGEPRWALATLLVLHLLAASYWVGALAPLRRAALAPGGAALLHRFGILAAGLVALLVVAGTGLAWLLSGSPLALVGTAYGWGLLAKVAVVAGLLGLAALNKLRLVPALQQGRPSAARALRRSIAWEGAAVTLILVATAAITTATVPPANL